MRKMGIIGPDPFSVQPIGQFTKTHRERKREIIGLVKKAR